MAIDIGDRNLVTVGQAATILHLHPNTVRRWSNSGILKAYRICKRGDRRFRREDIALLFESLLLSNRTETHEHLVYCNQNQIHQMEWAAL